MYEKVDMHVESDPNWSSLKEELQDINSGILGYALEEIRHGEFRRLPALYWQGGFRKFFLDRFEKCFGLEIEDDDEYRSVVCNCLARIVAEELNERYKRLADEMGWITQEERDTWPPLC